MNDTTAAPSASNAPVETRHLTRAELDAGLDAIRLTPRDEGRLEMIVARPAVNQRTVLETAELDLELGLRGDGWRERGDRSTPDGSADPDAQVTIMNSRAIALIAGTRDRWPLAGDQLFLDLDLSEENLPPGSQLELGAALLEITAAPHLGCRKFSNRYGTDATKFVNSPAGKQLHLRGLNARVVRAGAIQVGDRARKLPGV